MTPAYITKLGLTTQKTNVEIQKIDHLPLETHGMALAVFLLQNILRKIHFFEEIFLLADTSIVVVQKCPFYP